MFFLNNFNKEKKEVNMSPNNLFLHTIGPHGDQCNFMIDRTSYISHENLYGLLVSTLKIKNHYGYFNKRKDS